MLYSQDQTGALIPDCRLFWRPSLSTSSSCVSSQSICFSVSLRMAAKRSRVTKSRTDSQYATASLQQARDACSSFKSQHKNTLNQLVRMFHFANRLLIFTLSQFFKSPVLVHSGVQKILINRR